MLGSRFDRSGLAGELLDLEAWYFIEDFEIYVEFLVTWRHPTKGIGGVYRPAACGYESSTVYGPGHLDLLAQATVLEDAELGVAHHGGPFARDLRIAPVRDSTAPETYAALLSGPPFPRQSGLSAERRSKTATGEGSPRRRSEIAVRFLETQSPDMRRLTDAGPRRRLRHVPQGRSWR